MINVVNPRCKKYDLRPSFNFKKQKSVMYYDKT